MPASDGGDDCVGIGGTGEGFGLGVVLVEEAVDGFLEVMPQTRMRPNPPESQIGPGRQISSTRYPKATTAQGGGWTLRLPGLGPSREVRRIFLHRALLKVFDLPVKLQPMMFRPLEYR